MSARSQRRRPAGARRGAPGKVRQRSPRAGRREVATLIDGAPAASVSASDRAVHYGDGLFETISCVGGQARWLELHLQRLQEGCARLELPFRELDALCADIERLAAGQDRCLVKAIVTRGSATRRGYAPAGDERPTRLVSRYPWPEASPRAAEGFRVTVSGVRLGENPLLAGLKHLNRLEQVMAQLARPAGVDEVLMRSSSGTIVSGSMSNVFFVDAAGLLTPDLSACGVAGVMRRLVLGAARRLGLTTQVRPVAAAELGAMQEAFVTNVRWGVQSVRQLDGHTLPPADLAQRLRELIDAGCC